MTDLENRKDIELLVDAFYRKVIIDDQIGVFFTEVVKLDWNTHIPIMYDFWETTLLGKMKYKGNPMIKHLDLNRKMPLNQGHFERWLSLWEETLEENFQGIKAEEAVKKARQIGQLMQFKIGQDEKN